MIYHVVTRGLDEDGRLRIDALLGDARARAELDERRRGSAAAAGFEVG